MEPLKAIDQMCSSVTVVHAPRCQPPPPRHFLEAILTITIRATIGGADNWVEIEQGGPAPHPWRAACLDRTTGIPSPDTFGQGCALVEPTKLQQAFMTWRSALAHLAEEVSALAGTTIRRSLAQAAGTGASHVVRAWASLHELGLAPCQGDVRRCRVGPTGGKLR